MPIVYQVMHVFELDLVLELDSLLFSRVVMLPPSLAGYTLLTLVVLRILIMIIRRTLTSDCDLYSSVLMVPWPLISVLNILFY